MVVLGRWADSYERGTLVHVSSQFLPAPPPLTPPLHSLALSPLPTYRGTSLIRNITPVGPCSGPISRTLRWSLGAGRCFVRARYPCSASEAAAASYEDQILDDFTPNTVELLARGRLVQGLVLSHDFYPWSPFPPRRARPGLGPHITHQQPRAWHAWPPHAWPPRAWHAWPRAPPTSQTPARGTMRGTG